ncbi:D-alanyl-D-alanine carboxypeptidase [Granulicella sibirica]|uniref:D-alanyl-D-alanine carboxypeptidase n=1 Tax=Granulicella sibirica TaxID=2479048 RepID=A0A4Q0TAA0_9BACT|nr:D-alanyl-D-alanine carboxypeptidase [Granulicella sibirica]
MLAALLLGQTAAFGQVAGALFPAEGELGRQIRAMVAEPGVSRAHWGVAVTALDGTPIFGLNEAQYFQPASNAKMFTTSAALALLGPEKTYTTRVVGRGVFSGDTTLKGDLVLVGDGDANLSGRAIPYLAPKDRPKKVPSDTPVDPLRYLAEMADQVVATGLNTVEGDVVGDDMLFPWDPYAADWAVDDLVWGYGAPVSALTINDNQLAVTVRPGTVAGGAPSVEVVPAAPAYYTIDASGLTTGAAKSGSHVQMERAVGSRVLRIYGTIATDAVADDEEIAIHDPAEYGAMALKGMLEARGVTVTGVARAAHRLPTEAAGFLKASDPSPEARKMWDKGSGLSQTLGGIACSEFDPLLQGPSVRVLAKHQSVPLKDDLVVTNKVSQNLHAELFLQQVSRRYTCSPSRVEGAKVVRELLERDVAINPDDFVFFDGSGLSGHDLVTPRAVAQLLVWTSKQRWFEDWKKSLPIGGEDGSLAARFPKEPLKDHVFAKTGTLGEARALSGYVIGASGKTVVFSVMVGSHTPRTAADREVMDRIVGAIAAAN